MMKVNIHFLALAGLVFLAVDAVEAADEIEFHYGYYKDDNRLTVNTPSIKLSKDLFDKTNLSLKYTYEKFEKEAPPGNTLDAVTGATTVSGGSGSGFEEVRNEVIVGATHQIGSTTLGGSYFYGDEDDYQSDSFSLAISRELFQKNLTLTALIGLSFDEVDNLSKRPFEVFPKDKDTHTLTFAATQIVSPKMLITGGYSHSRVEGFQSLPLRKIRIESMPAPGVTVANIFEERHPRSRDRNTLFFRVKRYFLSRTAADLNLSYYFDSWGVNAFGNELRLHQYISDDLVVRLRYRFYTQTEADFFMPFYTQEQPLMTADVRLRKFATHTFGIKFVFALERTGFKTFQDWSISAGYDRYLETNQGLKAHIAQSSLNIPF